MHAQSRAFFVVSNAIARYSRLTETQRLQAAAQAKEDGNAAYAKAQPLRATSKYRLAIDLVRNVGLGSSGSC